MKENRKNNRSPLHNFIKLTLALLLTVLIPADSGSAFTPVEIILPISQTFLTSSGDIFYSAPSSVEYLLTASHPDNPLPDGTLGGQYTITLTGNQQNDTEAITITSPGVFEYTLTQVIPDNFIFKWTGQTFHITLYVKNDSSSMIVITNDKHVKVAEMAWVYTMPASGKPDGSDDSGKPSGTKPGPVTETTANAPGDTDDSSGEVSEESVRTVVDIFLEKVSQSQFLGGINSTLARTGDDSNRGLLGIVAALSLFGFLILVFLRVRSSQDDRKHSNDTNQKKKNDG